MPGDPNAMNPQGYVSDFYKNKMGPGFGGMAQMNGDFPGDPQGAS